MALFRKAAGGAAIALTLLLTSVGCRTATPPNSPDRPASQVVCYFRDVAAQSGLRFQYEIPGERPMNILQSMGGGAAFLDYDADGNLDILLTSRRVALFRGDGKGAFTDVTASALPALPTAWWQGIAVGDYDNDGFPDIYLSAYRGGVLLHNRGGTAFRDVTMAAGIKPQPWGSGCAFGDYDNDGRLDLFVGNYVQFGPDAVQLCRIKNIETACSPTVYPAEKNVLYRNLGGGKFGDVTKATGMDKSTGKALAAAWVDLQDKGWHSLLLANDEVPTDLMLNNNGKFKNIGEISGVAYLKTGSPYGGMGVDYGDVNGDGKLDIVIATFAVEEKVIFINEGDANFTDRSNEMGLGPFIQTLAFGEQLADFDNDGWLDLMMCNGYIADNVAEYEPTRTYRQPTLLFHNDKGQRFVNISDTAGEIFQKPIVGRALAVGDYDNDGKMDALIADAEGFPLLLHNETPAPGNYLTLRLIGAGKSNRDAYGTRVEIEADGRKRLMYVHADGSYYASHDPRVHIGLGPATSAKLSLRWPDGATQTVDAKEVNRQITVRQ